MGKNTSISLGDYFESFISNQITTGRYSSVSEVVRSALRLLDNEERKAKELNKALEIGEKSKMISDFDSKSYLQLLHKKHL